MEWFFNAFWATLGYAAASVLIPLAIFAAAFVAIAIYTRVFKS